jgi:hypothetical protein
MESNAVVEQVNRLLLKPLGFVRRGALFNRHRGEFVDVVDFPVNKAGDAVTLEVGIQHDGLYEALWEAPPPRFFNEASCIVHARIGELLEVGGDVWWPLADPASPDLALRAVEGSVLRFLQGHHDFGAIAAELDKALAIKRTPVALMYLAIIRHRRGDTVRAMALLGELLDEESGDWAQRAAWLAARLAKDVQAASAS